MNDIKLEERLDRIEKLLIGSKNVLTFDEAYDYKGISRSYMYKLTSGGIITHSKPNGKMIFFSKENLDKFLLQNSKKSEFQIESEALAYTFKKRKSIKELQLLYAFYFFFKKCTNLI
jgi:excisionase family DNA binding protein